MWFQRARDTRMIHVREVGTDEAVQGMDAIAFSAPIVNGRGEFLGVVSTRIGVLMMENVLTQTLHGIESRDGFLGTIGYQFMAQNGDVFVDSDLEHKGGVNLKRLGLTSAILSGSGESGYVEETHARRHVAVVCSRAASKGPQ